jgi:signal transduction histidine kinase
LDVLDDGVGFETDQLFPGHLGLKSMRERATRLHGSLEIDSVPGSGTRVTVRIPSSSLAAVAS